MKTKIICWKNSIYGNFDSNLQAWHNFGVGCQQIVADCFCNTDGIVNGDSLRGAEDSGKGKQAPLISVSHAVQVECADGLLLHHSNWES